MSPTAICYFYQKEITNLIDNLQDKNEYVVKV